ncbi:MAG TPA: glycine cleavage system aminomethyltransferase GcvT [Bryobacteraceae bacterium]|nr:glycine cleavage system aminomethyltransferase GcvT [Bryobacteraceae bacterium]
MRRTTLYEIHRRLGARMVDFGGWEMPLQYSSILEEHHAVRRSAGLFDVSHMGEIEIRGPEAGRLVNRVTTNDVSRLAAGQAQYSAMLYEHGGFVDDLLVHKAADDSYFLCVNAANQEKDYRHIVEHNRFEAGVENAGPRYAQLAIQGPRALETLQKLTQTPLAQIRYYHFVDGEVSGSWARIARTGYTGEDGFEIYLAPEQGPRAWEAIVEAGREFGVQPCGLGARNTLRLEAAMALYGHEIHASVTPWEAGLDWIVKLEKGDFVGREALLKQKQRGVTRKLAGFEMTSRGIARDGHEAYVDGWPAGWVTSGGPSPTLNKNIGLCYLPADKARAGQAIQILIRGQAATAATVPTPFYKRAP